MPQAKILVVDDEPFITRLLASRLKANDYEVIIANDGMRALNMAQEQKPDLIMLDIMMPQMDGFETATKLKGNVLTKDIPIIMLTAKGTQDSIAKAIGEIGAVGYIIKPFEPETLFVEIKKALNKKPNPGV